MTRVNINKSIWVIAESQLSFTAYKTLLDSLKKRGMEIFFYKPNNIKKLKKLIKSSEKHIIFLNPLDKKFKTLEDVLKKRRNFSVIYSDWWSVSLNIFFKYADYLIFNHFNAIKAIQNGRLENLSSSIPIISIPQKLSIHEIFLSLFRIPFFLVIPFIEIKRFIERRKFDCRKKRLLYFPFAIDNNQSIFKNGESEKKYDFANLGATSFFCRVKNYYTPAKLSFINLYTDRLKLINTIIKNPNFKSFDYRKNNVYGEKTLEIIKKSKYVISTGGFHQASVLKYLEIVACGTPIIGYKIPHEFPIINNCIYEIDVFSLNKRQLNNELQDAISRYNEFKNNALLVKKTILELYSQENLLDLLQFQYDGNEIPKDYIHF